MSLNFTVIQKRNQDHTVTLYIQLPDDNAFVVVEMYGTGEAALTVESEFTGDEVSRIDWQAFTPAIVWASPATIAHLIHDTIHNQ